MTVLKECIMKRKFLFVLYCVLALVFEASQVAIAYVLERVIKLVGNYSFNELIFIIILVIGTIIIFFLSSFLTSVTQVKLIRDYKNDLYSKIYNHLLDTSFSDFNKHDNAFYVSLTINDIPSFVENYLESVLNLLSASFKFVLSIAYLIYISPIIALLIFVASLIISLFPLFCSKELQFKQKQCTDAEEIFTDKVSEFFSFFPIVKIYKINNYEKNNLMKDTTDLNNKESKFNISSSFVQTIAIVLSYLAQISVFVVGAILSTNNRLDAASLVASVQVSGYVVSTITAIITSLGMIISSKPLKAKINNFFITQNDQNYNIPIKTYGIETFNLSFKYGKKEIFNNLNLNIKYGAKVLILGESGSGKSTLLKTLLGMNNQYSGNIKYGGVDLKDINSSLYNYCLLVPQENMIFHDTIKNNILLGYDFNEKELKKVIDLVELTSFVKNSKNGVNSIIRDNGKNISGGERQRIGLARALIRKPKILFLDESFSALDSETSISIKNKLLKLPITIIEVAHNNYDKDMFDLIINFDEMKNS